ncbi:hypothetical protein PsYK624_144490 [Phanerochaete sordida]|uniref:RING-type domain-containing protein n=1 Tax=Phanerochaete sordida TaxID=48140 RepID=A0A9P3GMR0_9APHY|nr:hypothetical protein PsYK624_144490 [Phanerochaete sordida]
MIALSPGSLCDVCAEEYGPHNYPHSIPCGHILCLNCCNNIIEKSSTRRAPCCPFCRDTFTHDGIRIMRVDYTPTSSGWSTPRGGANGVHDVIVESDGEDTLSAGLKSREQAKRLEFKVARVAGKKCSVDEVSTLHKELQDWLTSSAKAKPREQISSLELSAALLRAILMNYHAHSEATKAAKQTETQLTRQLEEADRLRHKLESELRSLRAEYSQLAQEHQSARAEMSKLKVRSNAPMLDVPSTPPPKSFASLQNGGLLSPTRPRTVAPTSPTSSTSDPRSRATSPTSPTPYSHAPAVHSPLTSRIAPSPLHTRSASVQPSSIPHRSFTPAIRSGTPASPARPELRSPSRKLSVSTPSPMKMVRSTSSGSSADEIQIQKDMLQKDRDAKRVQLIQRWLPNFESASPPSGGFYMPSPQSPPPPPSQPRSRTISQAHAAASLRAPLRYKTPVSATPS